MTPKLFSELGLSAEILKAIEKLGFEQAAPIQAAAIPLLMAGKDIVGQSQTGSGKTAAFGIPAIEKTDPNLRSVQVLLGHSNLQSTARYTHLSESRRQRLRSPLDLLGTEEGHVLG